MARRQFDDKRLREMQMKQGNGKGPGSRFGGLKEKPKDLKATIKQLLNYISFSKGLLIALIFVVILTTACTLSTNVFIEKIIASLGEYDVDNNIWEKTPNPQNFLLFVVLLASVYILYCVFSYISSILSAYLVTGMTRKMRNDLFARIVKGL